VLNRYARFVVRRRRAVLSITLITLVVSAVAFVDLGNRVTLEGFVVRHSESYEAKAQLERVFGIGLPNVVVVVTAKSARIDDPEALAAGVRLTRELQGTAHVANVTSYFSAEHPAGLLAKRGNRALILARLTGDDRAIDKRIRALAPTLHDVGGPVTVDITGSALFLAEGTDILQHDLSHAEAITAPITLLALLVVFGSLVAASIPLAAAGFVVAGTGLVLWLLSLVTSVSSFSLFFTTVLGLGLVVDYSLFMISRFREELHRYGNPEDAAIATVKSAGHTVMFSAAAVGVALAGLLVIPLQFMRSLGFAGIGTAAVAGTVGMVVLPALLATLGTRINRGRVWGAPVSDEGGENIWSRVAWRAMRRPRTIVIGSLLVLLAAGGYASGIKPGLVDDRLLGTNAEVRATGDLLRSDFDSRAGTPIPIVLPGVDGRSAAEQAKVASFARRLLAVEGVLRVDTVTGTYTRQGRTAPARGAAFTRRGSTYLNVTSSAEPLSAAGRTQIQAIRTLDSPFPEVLVTGDAAVAEDVTMAIVEKLPLAILFLTVASFVALTLQSRSIGAALLAMVLSAVSLAVMYAFMVFVFQRGHFAATLGFAATGTLYVNIVILLFCFAYGLAMDYQVFILSRIREEWDRCGDHERAIAYGLGRSGRIVSAAAVLIALVFFSFGIFSTSLFGICFGLSLGLAVLVDAFLIRATLVPAAMKLIGPRLWWAPRWLAPARPRDVRSPDGRTAAAGTSLLIARLRLLEGEAQLLRRELDHAADDELERRIDEFHDRSERSIGSWVPEFAEDFAIKVAAGPPSDADDLDTRVARLSHIIRRIERDDARAAGHGDGTHGLPAAQAHRVVPFTARCWVN
jgi:RND superfamily putative drug exporter